MSMTAGRPTISPVVQPNIASAAALNEPIDAVELDGEDPLRRVLDHRAVVRVAALRVVPRARDLHGLLRELRLGPFLVLTDRPGHPDRDPEHERAEEPDRLRLRPAQERRHPAFEHQQLAGRAAGQRPSERLRATPPRPTAEDRRAPRTRTPSPSAGPQPLR